jgi:hypothetical protein
MRVQPNILFIVHEGAPFVGDDANDHNLLPKGAPFDNAVSPLTLDLTRHRVTECFSRGSTIMCLR